MWLSADPKAHWYPSLSPYAYALNSPLMYKDPNGEWVHLVVGAVIGGVMNLAMNFGNVNSFWQGLGYFGIGAVAGALSAGIGAGANVAMAGGSFGAGFVGASSVAGVASTGFSAGFITGFASGFTGSFITGAGNTWMQGGSFGDGLFAGLGSGFKSGLMGGITGGVFGGIDAKGKGVDFWSGEGTFDLSNAYSASGKAIGDKTVTGKYVGTFEGVNVYESKALGDINGIDGYSGATLPPRGIVVGKGVYTSGKIAGRAMMQHEYGHILQYGCVGPKAYYSIIAPESLASASMHQKLGWNHDTFWTETWANHLAKGYFGTNWIGGSSYPVQDISKFNAFRLLWAR